MLKKMCAPFFSYIAFFFDFLGKHSGHTHPFLSEHRKLFSCLVRFFFPQTPSLIFHPLSLFFFALSFSHPLNRRLCLYLYRPFRSPLMLHLLGHLSMPLLIHPWKPLWKYLSKLLWKFLSILLS